MPLRTGDRGIVGVSRLALRGGRPWSCGRCGRRFPREHSWAVHYRHEDGDHYAFVVCPVCAAALTPVSVVIDLAALEQLPVDERWAEVDSLIRFIVARRSSVTGNELTVRWMDLDILASTYRMTVPEFVEWLRKEGVIATPSAGVEGVDRDG